MVVDAAFHIYRGLGPGLLESVYEAVLSQSLHQRGLHVQRQKAVTFEYGGMRFSQGLRVDLVVEDCLLVELKSVEMLAPVHPKQVLTYLRLMNYSLGLLLNFGAGRFDQVVRRIVNNHTDFANSRLRVNQMKREDTSR